MQLIYGLWELLCIIPPTFNYNKYFRYAMLIGRPPFETTEVKKTYERIKRNAY